MNVILLLIFALAIVGKQQNSITKYQYIAIMICIILYIIYLKMKKNKENFCSGTKTKKCTKTKLLPLMDPMFNIREISKQFILLEGHLAQEKARCNDCIIKHFLTLEALAEEAITLNSKKRNCELIDNLPEQIRDLQKKWLNNMAPKDLGQEIRRLRKPLMLRSFELVKKC